MWQSDMRSWVKFTHWAAHMLGFWQYSWDFYKKTNNKNKETAAISVSQMKPYHQTADTAAEGKSIAGYFWGGRYSIQVRPIIHAERPRVWFSDLTRPCNLAANKKDFLQQTVDGPLLVSINVSLTLRGYVATSQPGILNMCLDIFFFFGLFPSEVTTANHTPPSILCILFSHFSTSRPSLLHP